MKRNKLFILGICTVLVAMLSLSFVSGTWAKYTSSVSGSDTARVAEWKWVYGANETEFGYTEGSTITFDLFNTIKDTDGTSTEADVATDLIAPGTSGSFTFDFKNASEVNATYAIDYTITNAGNVPLEYQVGEGEWTSSLSDVTATAINMGQSQSVTVNWRWAFDGDHTSFGTKATLDTVTVAVEVTFTQVD